MSRRKVKPPPLKVLQGGFEPIEISTEMVDLIIAQHEAKPGRYSVLHRMRR